MATERRAQVMEYHDLLCFSPLSLQLLDNGGCSGCNSHKFDFFLRSSSSPFNEKMFSISLLFFYRTAQETPKNRKPS